MNVQTLWLRVLRDGTALDLVVDVPVVGTDGPRQVGDAKLRPQPRPRPRPQRLDEVAAHRDTSETYQ